MSAKYKSHGKSNLSGCIKYLVVILIIMAIYNFTRYMIDKSNYSHAHQAYRQTDCETAIKYYDKILKNERTWDFGDYHSLADQENDECTLFQDAVNKQSAGEYSASLVAYIVFVINNKDSILMEAVREKNEDLFKQAEPMTLVNRESCENLDILLDEDLLPKRDVNLPLLYYHCGKIFEDLDNWINAIYMYENFLDEYPNHLLANDIETALARSIIAQVENDSGVGELPSPGRSGSVSSGVTEVIIQNDSPERMRIVFSGPESHVEELAACNTCITYTGIGPMYCPEKGPIGRYTLTPGQYDVVVESISDSGTTPWKGEWELIDGDEYYSCFFIVTTYW